MRLPKMLVLRVVRPEKTVFGVIDFVKDKMGVEFVQPPPFNLQAQPPDCSVRGVACALRCAAAAGCVRRFESADADRVCALVGRGPDGIPALARGEHGHDRSAQHGLARPGAGPAP